MFLSSNIFDSINHFLLVNDHDFSRSSILLRVIVILSSLLILIPKVYRQAKGISEDNVIRKALFVSGLAYLFTIVVTIFVTVCRVYGCPVYYHVGIAAFLYSYGFYITFIMGLLLYVFNKQTKHLIPILMVLFSLPFLLFVVEYLLDIYWGR